VRIRISEFDIGVDLKHRDRFEGSYIHVYILICLCSNTHMYKCMEIRIHLPAD
jgi:hypothetical protein